MIYKKRGFGGFRPLWQLARFLEGKEEVSLEVGGEVLQLIAFQTATLRKAGSNQFVRLTVDSWRLGPLMVCGWDPWPWASNWF